MNTPKILSLVAVAGLSLSVIAQPEPPKPPDAPRRELHGNFERPLGEAGGAARSTTVMTQSDGNDTVTVKLQDGNVTAEVNGKPISADRIRHGDGKIEILNDKGEVAHTINIAFAHGGGAGGGVDRQARRWRVARPEGQGGFRIEGGPGGGVGGGGGAFMVAPPRAIMGITMSDADQRLLDHLGLDKATGVVVDSTMEGLGAEKAGLKPNDLIVEADGIRPLTQEKLTDVIKAKNPGDTVKIRYIRKGGQEQEVTITLQPYEADQFEGVEIDVGGGMDGGMDGGGDAGHEFFAFGQGFDHAAIEQAIRGALKALAEKGVDAEKIHEQVAEHLQKALGEFKKFNAPERFRLNFDPEAMKMFNQGVPRMRFRPDGGGDIFVEPAHPDQPGGHGMFLEDARRGQDGAPGDPQTANQLDRIANQLERLNKRLDELEKRLGERKP